MGGNIGVVLPEEKRKECDLQVAAGQGLVEKVTELVEAGVNVDAVDVGGWTALHEAAHKGHLNTLLTLLKFRADMSAVDSGGRTALHWAAGRGHVDLLRALIARGANVNAVDEGGRNALHRAAGKGQAGAVEILVDEGLDVNAADASGKTALHRAAQRGHCPTVECLLQAGSDISAEDNLGRVPLQTALHANKQQVVDLLEPLMKTGAVLFHSAYNGNLELLHWLISNGVNITITDKDGCSAVHHASRGGTVNILEYLQNIGIDLSVTDHHGQGAIHYASREGRVRTLQWLRQQGGNLSGRDLEGRCSIHLASSGGHIDTLQWLLTLGLDLSLRDKYGCNAVHYALKGHQTATAVWLLDNGLDITAVDCNGQTALHWAVKLRNVAAVKAIMARSADPHVEDVEGIAPLGLAATVGEPEITEALENSVLYNIFKWNDRGALVQLLRVGIDVNSTYGNGDTSLHMAIKMRNLELASVLLEHGSDVTAHNSAGDTALDIAVREDNVEAVKILIHSGANLNARGSRQETPLHLAALNSNLDILLYLLACGADSNACDERGQTPLHKVVQLNNLEAVKVMRNWGANPKKKDFHQKSPLDIAMDNKDSDIIKELERQISAQTLYISLESDLVQQYVNDSFQLQKEIHPLHVYKDINGTGKVCKTTANELVRSEVKRVVENITESLAKLFIDDESSQFKFAIPTFENVGSSKERTKIEKPDEFDYILILQCGQLRAYDQICGLFLCPPGYSYLVVDDKETIPNIASTLRGEMHDEDLGRIVSSTKFHQWFWQQLRSVLADEDRVLRGTNNLRLKYRPDHGYFESKACSTITMTWLNEPFCDMDIEVDMTPAFRMDEVCPFISPQNARPAHYYMVPKPPHQNSLIGVAFDDETREAFWHVDFVKFEGDMVAQMPDAIKDAYATCKCVRAMVPKLMLRGELLSAGKFVSSYMMKLIFMKEARIFLEQKLPLEQMVLRVLETLVACLRKEHMSDYWAFRIPYSEDLQTYERNDLTSYGYGNALAGSKRDLRHNFRVARLLKFMVEELVEHKETIEQVVALDGKCTYATLQVFNICASGNVRLAEKLQSYGANFAVANQAGLTTIHYAARGGHLKMAQWLLDHGVDFRRRDHLGVSAVHHACAGGHVAVVDYLVKCGASLVETDGCGHNAAHYACSGGQLEMLQWLAAHDVDYLLVDNSGFSALHHVCSGYLAKNIPSNNDGREPITMPVNNDGGSPAATAQWLVNHGVPLTSIDDQGRNILQHAVAGRRPGLVDWLLQQKVFELDDDVNPDQSVLAIALSQQDITMTSFLVNSGASYHGIMTKAAKEGKVDIVKTLIAGGADWQPILVQAARQGKTSMIRVLIAGGVDHQSALIRAADQGDTAVVRSLIVGGADDKGALMKVALEGNVQLVRRLINGGANHRKVLSQAVDLHKVEVIKTLIDGGADRVEILVEKAIAGDMFLRRTCLCE